MNKASFILFLILLLGSSQSFASQPGSGVVIEKVLCKVQDTPIFLSEKNELKKNLRSGQLVDQSLLGLFYSKKPSSDKEIFDYLKKLKTLDHLASKEQVTASHAECQSQASNLAQKNNMSIKQLQTEIEKTGVSWNSYIDFLCQSLSHKNLIQKNISSKVKVSPEEVYFQLKNKNIIKGPFPYKYTLSHIKFSDNELSLFKSNRSSLINLNKFKAFSETKQEIEFTRFGEYTASDLNPSFQSQVSNLDVNKTSEPVKINGSYYVLFLEKKTKDLDFNKYPQAQQIYGQLYQDKLRSLLNFWLMEKQSTLASSCNA